MINWTHRVRRFFFVLPPLFHLLLFCGAAHAAFPEKVVAKAKRSTVFIMSMVDEDNGATGTGFIIDKSGVAVTNYHVVEGANVVLVIYASGTTGYVKEARVLAQKKEKDIAVLKFEPIPGTLPIPVVDRDTTPAQEVMAIGFPGVLG